MSLNTIINDDKGWTNGCVLNIELHCLGTSFISKQLNQLRTQTEQSKEIHISAVVWANRQWQRQLAR